MAELHGAHILIVDDHADVGEDLGKILEAQGATVAIASSATDALAQTMPYDVALVDVGLPDGRGPELIPLLRRRDEFAEVLLITGNASLQDAMAALRAGAFAFVTKPIDPQTLVTTVVRAFFQARLRRDALRMQHEIEQRESALRTLVDTVQTLLLVLNEDEEIVQANKAVALATGCSQADLAGKRWSPEFVPAADHEIMRTGYEHAKQGGDNVAFEARVSRRAPAGQGVENAAERLIRWRLVGVRHNERHLIYASGIDVTEVRELERRARLAEKLAAVGTISAGLAHEIRNPLNAANLQLQLLERRVGRVTSETSVLEPIATVRREIARLDHLVSDFLAFARPQSLNLIDVDLCKLAAQVVDLERPEASQKRIELVFDVCDEPIRILADEPRLRQVLLNLVRNALDATGSGAWVRVSVNKLADGNARIVVSDSGAGIPEELRTRVFEPFFTTKEAGTGLGLAIAHKLIELHGGHIDIGGASHGTTVSVELPRRPPGSAR